MGFLLLQIVFFICELSLEHEKVLRHCRSGYLLALITHSYSTNRAVANKRPELRLQCLIEAYRILTNEVYHWELTSVRNYKLQCMLSDIQLFGTGRQVKLVKELTIAVAAENSLELAPLINSLRDDLRSELNIEKTENNVQWLRGGE